MQKVQTTTSPSTHPKQFKVSLKLQAENQVQVEEKLQAFHDLNNNMEHDDLLAAVDVVVENPDLVEFIKEVAPKEGQELGLLDYISIAKKAYKKFT